MNIAAKGYEFVAEIAPAGDDVLLPKKHPSAFYGTPLASYLVAKGVDSLAQRIKKVARENDVVCYEDVPLARALYRQVEIGQEIPEDLYAAVAAVRDVAEEEADGRGVEAVAGGLDLRPSRAGLAHTDVGVVGRAEHPEQEQRAEDAQDDPPAPTPTAHPRLTARQTR